MVHHGAGLRELSGNAEWVAALTKDYRQAELTEADRAMLDYVEKLTREPWNLSQADLEPLRAEGFDDRAILDINQVTGYYAFVNRLADGLGVELEDVWTQAKTETDEP